MTIIRPAKFLLVVFLLLGAVLRLSGLGFMHDQLDYDEAYYGLDALSLLENPRFVPFFPDNNGRESLWMYVLVPSLAVSEARPYALRIVAVFVGILTMAAVYRLARELFDHRTAIWSTGALAVLYWHVHMSHLAFRAVLYPLLGTLAFAALLRARRKQGWLLAGTLLGLLAYTYFAARLWVALALLMQFWFFYRQPELRRGILRSLLTTLVITLPLVLYTLANPDSAFGRIGDQAALSPQVILQNIGTWLGAWLGTGSTYEFHNPIGRPILDIPLAILVIASIVSWRRSKLILTLALLAVIPSILSTDAAHFLRAVGLTIPIALLAGIGANNLHAWIIRRGKGWIDIATLLPLVLILASSLNTFTTFQTWARNYQFPGGNGLKLTHTQHIVAALEHEAALPLYLYESAPTDPVFRFMLARFHPRPLELLNFADCTLAPAHPFIALTPLDYAPSAADPLAMSAQLDLLLNDRSAEAADFGYSLYRAIPLTGAIQAVFGDELRVDLLVTPALHAQPGDTITLSLKFTPLRPLERPYTVFLHLLDSSELAAQADLPICPEYPTTRWQVGQAITQTVSLTLPAELAPGEYALSLGIYDSVTLIRLPLKDDDSGILNIGVVTAE